MSKGTEKSSFFEKLATVIVDKRNLIFFLYACALIFCLFSRNWVSVCNDITEYLPETTETRQGLTLMEEEFTTFGTARVMVSHVTYEIAEELAEQMEQIEGVTSATFGSSTVGADTGGDGEPETPEDITEYFKGADALISVTFDGEEEDEISLAALAAIRELLEPYDYYIDSAVGNSQADSLASEMGTILAVAAVIIVLVLLLTSRSYAEIPVLLITFIVAALLNLGTNFIFGEISFVSNSVTVVLQLALAIDYAIIMLHRFLEEREYAEDREACIAAVSAAIPSISASSLTSGTLCQGCLRNSLAVIQNKPLDFVAHGFFARFAEMDFDAVGGFPYFLYHNRLRGFLYGQRGSSCGGAGLAGFIVHSLSFLLMANAPVTQ